MVHKSHEDSDQTDNIPKGRTWMDGLQGQTEESTGRQMARWMDAQ